MDQVSHPTAEDVDWLDAMLRHAEGLLDSVAPACHFQGSAFDLALALKILEIIVGKTDDLSLQALGVVLGNVFVTQNAMRWSVVTNDFGALLAVHHDATGVTLYPVTMIQKRVHDRRHVDIPQLYHALVHDFGFKSAPVTGG